MLSLVVMCEFVFQGKTNGVTPEVTKKTKAAAAVKKVSIPIFFPLSFKVNNTFLLLQPWRLYSTVCLNPKG